MTCRFAPAAVALSILVAAAPLPQALNPWRATPTAQVKSAADGGDAKAAIELGLRYEQGKGIPKDVDEALKYFRKAADNGDADAQLLAGQRLAYGPGPNSDKIDAFRYFSDAAKGGSAQALYEVGLAQKLGRGTTQDAPAAIASLKRAAEAGVAAAQFELGDCYEAGTGAAADPKQAAYFYRRAADQNHPTAQLRLGRMMIKGTGGVTTDPRGGLQLILKAAQSGLVDAQWDVAQRFINGEAAARDASKAVPWLIKLCDQKHEPAQQQLAKLSPDALRKAAKKLTFVGDVPSEDLIGAVITADGTMFEAQGDKGKLAVTWHGKQVPFTIENLPSTRAQNGTAVRVYATLAEKRTLRGLLVDLEKPSFEYKYALRNPGSMKAGDVKKFVVDGAVKNTGKQTLRNVKVKCRLYQQNSPNDADGEVTIKLIKPGEVVPVLFHVDFLNFQYLGATSTPKVEMSVTDYDF